MIVGTLRIRLLLRNCHSLKEKRSVIRSLKQNLHNKFNVAAAEVDHQDVWQTAEIGVAAVGGETPHVREILTNVEQYVRFFGGVEVCDLRAETFQDDD
jgi:uncharacterized protein